MASDVPASTNPIAHSRTWHTSSEQTTDPQVDKFGHGPDRGHGYYAFARERDHKPSLVSIGRYRFPATTCQATPLPRYSAVTKQGCAGMLDDLV